MITFKDAVIAAERLNANHGECIEMTDCYIFSCLEYKIGPSPVVIIKETGDSLYYPEWISSRSSNESKYVKTYKQIPNGKWEFFVDEDYE